MKKVTITIMIISLLVNIAHAAYSIDSAIGTKSNIISRHPIRKGVWFLPTNVNEIDGLAVGIWTERFHNGPLHINGMNLDVQPAGLLLGFMLPMYHIPYLIKKPDDNTLAVRRHGRDDSLTYVRGFDLRLFGGLPESNLNGFGLSGVMSSYTFQNGVAISLILNSSDEIHGVQVGGVGNIAWGGKGVQIGLFNRSTNCDCLQLGLLNRSDKSLQPIINWKHRKKGTTKQ